MNFMVGSSCSYTTRDVGDCSLYTSCANVKITGYVAVQSPRRRGAMVKLTCSFFVAVAPNHLLHSRRVTRIILPLGGLIELLWEHTPKSARRGRLRGWLA
jgi:hypothetical protein